VVIAIIGILMSILIPLFTTVKEKARQTTCLNNLCQLGKAFRLYADEYDGRLPAARVNQMGPSGGGMNWCGCISVGGQVVLERAQTYPYAKSTKIFLCPSDVGRRAPKIASGAEPYPLSYSMNNMLSWRDFDTMRRRPIGQDGNLRPSSGTGANKRLGQILLLVHEDRNTINDGDYHWSVQPVWDVPEKVHYNGTTLLYCDLHAMWQSKTDLLGAIAKQQWDPDANFP
jgi:hypothetical protein